MSANDNLYDAIIVGGGPAGLTAALYLARARYRVLVVEKDRFGGQITITHEVVNYPGVESTSGEALTDTMRRQAINFGAETMLTEVTDLKLDGDIKEVTTTRGVLRAFAVLICTGANPRRVGFKGEDEFRGHGVAYCATCDGEFFTGKELLVIGGGYASAEEAMFLTRYASKVTILVRKDSFSCARSIAEEVMAHPKISVLFNHELKSVEGTDMGITSAEIFNNKTQETFTYKAKDDTFGVFVFAGYVPNTALVKDKVALNEQNYIITDENHETNVPGVFAAGDVCIKTLRQVVTATADGALAAAAMEKVAAKMHDKTGLVPEVPNATRKAPEEPRASVLPNEQGNGKYITDDLMPQLNAVFERMEHPVTLRVHAGDDEKSHELLADMKELSDLSDKLKLEQVSDGEYLPFVELVREDGTSTGMAFHGVPEGHEFSSFVLAFYNASGHGQPIDEELLKQVKAIDKNVDIKVLVSLSCTMCPDLVVAAQRMASLSDKVTAHIYDAGLYPDLRTKYRVMSVPCLVINDTEVTFGKKKMPELLEYLRSISAI